MFIFSFSVPTARLQNSVFSRSKDIRVVIIEALAIALKQYWDGLYLYLRSSMAVTEVWDGKE